MLVFYFVLRRLDREFAVVITARHWLKPLYGDFTLVGYVFGFVFRTLRILAGTAIYVFIAAVFLILFMFWAVFPPFVVYKIIFYAGKF